jgi:DNA-binding transcriptional ArsR family regulator
MTETTHVTVTASVLSSPSVELDDLAVRLKSVGHSTRLRIVARLHTDGRSSPSEMADDLDEPLGNISYHVRQLLKGKLIALVDEQPRRGAVEHYYELTERGRQVLAGVERFLEAA